MPRRVQFYGPDEARKYTTKCAAHRQRGCALCARSEAELRAGVRSSRIIEIQSQMARRAVELLALPAGRACFLLDIGCGSGLSGGELRACGYHWAGIDISRSMLGARARRVPYPATGPARPDGDG